MQKKILHNWSQLQPRERLVLGRGAILVSVIIGYVFIWQPWHVAIDHMQTILPNKRVDLIWMRHHAELAKQSGPHAIAQIKGADQSLMAVLEQSARSSGVQEAIQQMAPGENDQEASVVLGGVSFNQWIRWVDSLQKQYAVSIKQLTADREEDQPDTAEIRVTFSRDG